ncbi:MAG: AbrB/MazE/SpoVT family DNA-binding domain-containing protein [Coriobacteriales bacterium]
MTTMMSTKLTKGGQTTVPKEIRTALGIEDGGRVYWGFENGVAYIFSEPQLPNTVTSHKQFWAGIEAAEAALDAGAGSDANAVSARLKTKYGI